MPHPRHPPLPTSTTLLPAVARRILHSLTTVTQPSTQLPSLLSSILSHGLHLNTVVSSSFIMVSLVSHRCLSPALRLFSLLPSCPPPHPFVSNSLLRSLLPYRPSLLPPIFLHLLLSSFRPNRFTYPPLLKSLTLTTGPHHHHHPLSFSLPSRIRKSGLLSDPHVRASLLSLYASLRDVPSFEALFREIPSPDVSAWTALVRCYSLSGLPGLALLAFERMHFARVPPNRVTILAALPACSSLAALPTGLFIHSLINTNRWHLDVKLGTALVDMYAKCGRTEDALAVFASMDDRNVYTWNALIGGCGGKEALRWFSEMEADGVRPDEVTLIEVLRACAHSGLVDEGRRIFVSVASGYYGFYPGVKHYGCFVDLLGRAGCLEEAVRCIETMPFEPGVVMWGSLLGGCRAHGDLRMSEFAARKLVELEPENVAHYVLLSNLYAEMGRWRDAEEVRRLARERGMRKDAGWSFAELGKVKDGAADSRCWEVARAENSSVPESYEGLCI